MREEPAHAIYVGKVEIGIDLVEQEKGRGLVEVESQDNCQCDHGLLASRELFARNKEAEGRADHHADPLQVVAVVVNLHEEYLAPACHFLL